MPHYKDPDNKIHWIDSFEFELYLPSGSVQITDEEAATLRPVPEAFIPDVVSMRQARLALLQSGKLDAVTAAINAGTDAGKITWEYATEVRREDALVANLSATLGLSETDLDNLFTLAATL